MIMQSKVVPRAFVLMTVLFYFKEEIMEYSIVWILFIAGCLFLLYFYSGKFRKMKAYQKQQQAIYEQNRIKYRHFTSELFDETADEELTHAVLFHILAKEDKLYEGDEINQTLVEILTPSELLIYTIYQVELSMEGGRGSLHSFFIKEPYCLYRPYVQEAFKSMNCYDIAELMEAADKLATMIENDQEIEIDESSDYGKYNFSDFTNALLAMLKSSGLVEKAGSFIRAHKNDFIDLEGENDEQTTGAEV